MNHVEIGVDIEEVARFKRLIRSKVFLNRVFTSREIAYCNTKKNRAQHFAVRFAAKEAVWKALSETLAKRRLRLGHRDIGLTNNLRGKPEVVLPPKFGTLTKKISVSLSHTDAYVVAAALVRG